MPKYFSFAGDYFEVHDTMVDALARVDRAIEDADPVERPAYCGEVTRELVSYGFAPAVEGAEFDYWRQLKPGAPGEMVIEPHDLFDWALISDWVEIDSTPANALTLSAPSSCGSDSAASGCRKICCTTSLRRKGRASSER